MDRAVCTAFRPPACSLLMCRRIYNAITVVGLLCFYHPHAHVRAEGLSWKEVVKRIDFLGGFLSIVGLTLLYVRKRLISGGPLLTPCLASWLSRRVATRTRGRQLVSDGPTMPLRQ